jgi:hypothetical protein
MYSTGTVMKIKDFEGTESSYIPEKGKEVKFSLSTP